MKKAVNRMIYSLLIQFDFCNAEREGFEPPVPRGTTVFKTAAFDHSAISPILLKSLWSLTFQVSTLIVNACKSRFYF